MIKKFICKNCNKTFETENQDSVICPHCHSDNVEPFSYHIPALVRKFIVSAIVMMLACCVLFFFTSRCSRSPESNPIESESELETKSNFTPGDPPTVSVTQPVFNDNGLYSVLVKGKNIPHGVKFYYVMLTHFDQKIIQKNEDGHFSNIPYCEDDGHSYDFAIMDSRADTLICLPVEQTGFVKQVVIDNSKKMTQEQLQKLIDTQDVSLNGVGESDYLAPDYQLVFTGIPSDMKKPESWTELFEMIEYGILKSVTISQLGYDDKNRINIVKLNVTLQ